jgi:hypothetical protein
MVPFPRNVTGSVISVSDYYNNIRDICQSLKWRFTSRLAEVSILDSDASLSLTSLECVPAKKQAPAKFFHEDKAVGAQRCPLAPMGHVRNAWSLPPFMLLS